MFDGLFWYLPHIWDYFLQMVPCMCAALILYFLTLRGRVRRLQLRGLISPLRREIVFLIFIMYLAGLAALTLFPADFWFSVWSGRPIAEFYPTWEKIFAETDYRNLFAPFQEIRRAITKGSRWLWLMLLSNILMFIPLGLLPTLLWRRWRWWKAFLFGALTSVSIETVQFFIGRSTDIDDVILNTGGTLLGFWLYCLLRGLFPRGISKFQCYTDGSTQEWTN